LNNSIPPLQKGLAQQKQAELQLNNMCCMHAVKVDERVCIRVSMATVQLVQWIEAEVCGLAVAASCAVAPYAYRGCWCPMSAYTTVCVAVSTATSHHRGVCLVVGLPTLPSIFHRRMLQY
jgi:hypothetical protein